SPAHEYSKADRAFIKNAACLFAWLGLASAASPTAKPGRVIPFSPHGKHGQMGGSAGSKSSALFPHSVRVGHAGTDDGGSLSGTGVSERVARAGSSGRLPAGTAGGGRGRLPARPG